RGESQPQPLRPITKAIPQNERGSTPWPESASAGALPVNHAVGSATLPPKSPEPSLQSQPEQRRPCNKTLDRLSAPANRICRLGNSIHFQGNERPRHGV